MDDSVFRCYTEGMKEKHSLLFEKIHKFINQMIFLEKKNIYDADGVKLYPSEIHLILIVNENPTNATQMAERLGITKGAVSQTITRLERKGILRKEKDPQNKNKLTLHFTPLGKKIFTKYQRLTSEAFRKYAHTLTQYSDEELDTIDRFLTHLGKMFL
jgi:DNA-binding MarR family transcriptional regulator